MENIHDNEVKQAKSLLGELLANAKLYQQSQAYWELLQFVVKLRNVAPFNAMLLHIQKPGIRYVASQYEWERAHHRTLKPGARPLVILWPFSPVAFVYDVGDTVGNELPSLAYEGSFKALCYGAEFREFDLKRLLSPLRKINIHWQPVDTMDQYAGNIKAVVRKEGDALITEYHISLNQNHSPVVRLATLIHELGHLFLGHLGANKSLCIKARSGLPLAQKELEAESLSFLVCSRNDIETNSERYLAGFIGEHEHLGSLDIYELMKAANQIERLLNLGGAMKFR